MTGYDRESLLAARPLGAAYEHTVRFQDVDAAGIVFYPRLLEFFHDSYVAFLRAAGQPLEVALWDRAWAAPIKWAEGHFLRPVRFGDRLNTAIVRAQIEGGLWLGFRSMLPDSTPVAVGTTQAVFVNLATFRKAEAPASLVALFNGMAAERDQSA